jgi:hypothetical protein
MVKLKTPTKKIIIIASLILLVIASVAILWRALSNESTSTQSVDTTPSFQTLLPSNESIDDLGGWQKLSPPGSDPFYVYTDLVDGVAINVSQQPIPASFSGAVEQKVDELAKAYNATQAFEDAGVKVYIGTSANGPQSVIFTKDEILVLIKSQSPVTNDAWKSYIASLI